MSSYNQPKYVTGLKAGADLSADANRYIALKLAADGDVEKAGAGEAKFIGFLQNNPANGGVAEVYGASGGSKAIAAGNISAGDFLKTDANGHVLAISGETANAVAIAMESAVDNDVFEVLVFEPGKSVTVA